MASVSFNFTQANGTASGWTNTGAGRSDLQVIGNRLQIGDTAEHEGYRALAGLTLSDYQIDFDCWAPTSIGAGSVGVTILNSSTFDGWQYLVANSTHLYKFVAGSRGSYLTNDPRSTNPVHVTITRQQSTGLMRIYLDGVLNSNWTESNTAPGSNPLLIVYMQGANYPSEVPWMDDLVISDTITGPPTGSTKARTASLAGTGGLTAGRSLGRLRHGELQAQGSLSASRTVIKSRTGSLGGSSTLSASKDVVKDRTASLSGSSTLAAARTRARNRNASLASAGSIAATQVITHGVTRTGSLSGSATLAAGAYVAHPANGTITGSSTLAGVRRITRNRGATATSTGTLTATATITHPGTNRTATLTASGALSAVGRAARPRTAALGGSAGMVATGRTTRPRSASAAGFSALSADHSIVSPNVVTRSGFIISTSDLSSQYTRTLVRQGSLAGVSSLTSVTPEPTVGTFEMHVRPPSRLPRRGRHFYPKPTRQYPKPPLPRTRWS